VCTSRGARCDSCVRLLCADDAVKRQSQRRTPHGAVYERRTLEREPRQDDPDRHRATTGIATSLQRRFYTVSQITRQ